MLFQDLFNTGEQFAKVVISQVMGFIVTFEYQDIVDLQGLKSFNMAQFSYKEFKDVLLDVCVHVAI